MYSAVPCLSMKMQFSEDEDRIENIHDLNFKVLVPEGKDDGETYSKINE